MRVRMQYTIALLLSLTGFFIGPAPADSQPATASGQPPRAELGLGYSYLRSNAPPGGCTCFNLNGGNAAFAWPLGTGRFALVGDVSAGHTGNIGSGGYSLTLSAYTAGMRYTPRLVHSSLRPFGQALIGVAHSSGSLVRGQGATVSNAGAAFAANLGGGLDLSLNHRFSIRLIEADYLLTTFDNASNNRQNNLRLGAGVVVRFGRR